MRLTSGLVVIASSLAALCLVSCASSAMSGDMEATGQAATRARAPEIMRLRTREGDVALLAGSGGRVVVYDARGVALRTSDVDGLRASDPALYELLTTAVASHGPYLDATLSERSEPVFAADLVGSPNAR